MGTWSVRLNLSSHKLPFLLLGSQIRGLGEGAGEGPRPEARVLTSLGCEHRKTIKPRLKAGQSHSPCGRFLISSPWTSEGLGLVVSPRNLVATRGMTLPGRRVFAVTRNVTDAHMAL